MMMVETYEGIDPEFYTLLKRSEIIRTAITKVKDEPALDVKALRALTKELSLVANKMQRMLPAAHSFEE